LFLLHFDETPFLSFRTMLSMSNLSADQAENYYEKDDYYTQDLAEDESQQQSQGKSQVLGATWYGKGAAALGLAGVVEQPVFKKLLHGKTQVVEGIQALDQAGCKITNSDGTAIEWAESYQ
jgi:hypothetical protein